MAQRRPKHPRVAEWYKVYLSSEEWILKRELILAERGHVCQDCAAKGPRLTLHHITYARVQKERGEDLRILCSRCHQKAHRKHDVPYLFLIYRENYPGDVAPILRGARKDDNFPYPRWRHKINQPKETT